MSGVGPGAAFWSLDAAGTVPVRPDLQTLEGYHSPQGAASIRLNTNESPLPPPDAWVRALSDEVGRIDFHRYPDRRAVALTEALAAFHKVDADRVFCANGSNEVLQCLLLAYGGPTRHVAVFEPTYALHSHLANVTGTPVATGWRTQDHELDMAEVDRVLAGSRPVITFLCSPNNPTGRSDPSGAVEEVLRLAPGLVVVDEAYGQFAPWSAIDLHAGDGDASLLVVSRTFSKTWSMAGTRLGYLVAAPDVVEACWRVVLPYHLDAVTQAAGLLALRFVDEMEDRVAFLCEERGRLAAGLASLAVETWPSDANFILFRPKDRSARTVWHGLVDRSVLVRDFSDRPGLDNCLRVTVGTPDENDQFLTALQECLA